MTKHLLAAASVACLFAFPAFAQQCAPTADAERLLRERHGETIVAYGLMQSGAVMQVWAGPNGSWTVIVTDGNVSCLVIDGAEFAEMAAKPNT